MSFVGALVVLDHVVRKRLHLGVLALPLRHLGQLDLGLICGVQELHDGADLGRVVHHARALRRRAPFALGACPAISVRAAPTPSAHTATPTAIDREKLVHDETSATARASDVPIRRSARDRCRIAGRGIGRSEADEDDEQRDRGGRDETDRSALDRELHEDREHDQAFTSAMRSASGRPKRPRCRSDAPKLSAASSESESQAKKRRFMVTRPSGRRCGQRKIQTMSTRCQYMPHSSSDDGARRAFAVAPRQPREDAAHADDDVHRVEPGHHVVEREEHAAGRTRDEPAKNGRPPPGTMPSRKCSAYSSALEREERERRGRSLTASSTQGESARAAVAERVDRALRRRSCS